MSSVASVSVHAIFLSHFHAGTPPFIGVLNAVSDPQTSNHYRTIYPRSSRLSQRSNCCRSRKCIRWHIPVHAIFAVFDQFFLPVLSRPSKTPNKDHKTE